VGGGAVGGPARGARGRDRPRGAAAAAAHHARAGEGDGLGAGEGRPGRAWRDPPDAPRQGRGVPAAQPLAKTAHTSRPWRIHAITPDFRVEDVWALPTPGGPDDFPRLVERATTLDPARGSSRAARALFAIRWKLGELLGWDDEHAAAPTLRDRLPPDLHDTAAREHTALPFRPLYETGDEFAAEVANRTVHGVLHLGWVEDGEGGYRGQMAVLVKPNGLLGKAYMVAIKPFRHTLVYPALLRDIERAWRR
jgi:hypothetical protein